MLDLRSMRVLSHRGRVRRLPDRECCCATCRRQAARPGSSTRPTRPRTASSIGGNIATNASGSRSFRYGDTRANVLGLRVGVDGRHGAAM